jgi:hypothetical protein
MEIINVSGRLVQIGDEVDVCTKGENPRCFRAKIAEIGGDIVLEQPEGDPFSVPVESFRRGYDNGFRYRVHPYKPGEDPNPLIQKVLQILREEKP